MRKTVARLCGAATLVSTQLLVSSPAMAEYTAPSANPGAAGRVTGLTSRMDTLLGIFMYVVIAGCIAGMFIVAFKMATAYRNGEFGESAGKFAAVAAACIVVGVSSGFVRLMINEDSETSNDSTKGEVKPVGQALGKDRSIFANKSL